jgi:hypothetical protein
MAKEIILEDGRTALFDDDATEADIEKKLKSQNLKRQAAPEPTKEYASVPQLGPVVPGLASAANSLLFGVPEMAARAMGGGEYIDAVRQEYPMATTAGDVAGLANPYRLAAKVGQKAMGAAMRPGAASTFQIMRNADEVNRAAAPAAGMAQTVRNVAQRTAGIGTGMIGAQTGAAALGGARSENYGAGAQQGAQVFQNTASNLPGTQLIPGAQSTINAATSIVPGALGYGSALANYLTIDEMIRQEAAKRAMQGIR